ncbi:FHA domain-containing protein [Colwellia piezophila]|uniref:FHA domain-containing protein n=1 Tax=Colwellia piezophila TaxID=211668 RepID=UPI000375DCF9|nr:FHA domain-containing protein [Colwellia piezophila]
MEVTKSELEQLNEVEPVNTSTPVDIDIAPTEIIIEEITRNHKLLHRHRINQDEITIGRGYQNDIILADPHICPLHLSLTFAQGVWRFNDNNSVNGTVLESNKNNKQDKAQRIVNDGDVIIIGKSQLRVVFSNRQVAETVVFSPFESLIDFIRHPIAVFISIALFMLIAANITYLNQPTEINFSHLFVSAFKMALLFALWPTGIALVSHLTKHDPRVLAQLGISFSFFILLWLSYLLEEIINFNSASHANFGLAISLLPVGLSFSLFWLNSYIGFHVSAKRRMIVSISITALLFGGSYLIQYSKKPEFNPHPQYNATIMAPKFLVAPSSNVETFLARSAALFKQASKAAQKDQEM